MDLTGEKLSDAIQCRCPRCRNMFWKNGLKKQAKLVGAEPPPTSKLKEEIQIVNIREKGHANWKLFLNLLGMPIIESDEEHPHLPYVSFSFLAVCFLIYFMFQRIGPYLALTRGHYSDFLGLNFFTYALVHGSFFHLFFNSLFIFPFMDGVEAKMGSAKTAAFIFAAAVSSGIFHVFLDDSSGGLIGASGVCFAFAVYYCLTYPKHKLIMAIPVIGLFVRNFRVRINAWVFGLFYFLVEFWGSVNQGTNGSRVSHLGHYGGAIFAICAYYFTKKDTD
jgi:membrane associated rhomboid family serine protease